MKLQFIEPSWDAPNNVRALTTTRLGGVSLPPFDSLNLGEHVGDDKVHVIQNRQLLGSSLEKIFNIPEGTFHPIWLRQEHTCEIAQDKHLDSEEIHVRPFDGMFTQRKNVVCTIMTADCLPVFICNQEGSEISLVHAGWRGLADGIVEKAINSFSVPAENLLVHCGPAISQSNFEIGSEVKQQLGGSERCYQKSESKPNHYFADLYGLLKDKVEIMGASYSQSDYCTYADKDLFYSYRREGATGRMVSLLWLE